MLRKYLFLSFILAIVCDSGFAQTGNDEKEAAFVVAAKAIIDDFHKKNAKELDKWIEPKAVVYIMYRPGAEDTYKRIGKFDASDAIVFENTAIAKPNYIKTPFQYGKLPIYNCEKNSWNKKGFFADSTKQYAPLSKIAAFRTKFDEEKYTKKDLAKIKLTETGSRKVIYAESKGTGIVFYLYWSGSRWYLSIVDVITTDCSA